MNRGNEGSASRGRRRFRKGECSTGDGKRGSSLIFGSWWHWLAGLPRTLLGQPASAARARPRAGGCCAFLVVLAMSLALLCHPSAAAGQSSPVKLRVGALSSGTWRWELTVIEQLGLDRKNGFDLELFLYAGQTATGIAVQGGAVDCSVHDWLWVARQRARGLKLQALAPFTMNTAALIVPKESPIQGLADLRGKRLGVVNILGKGYLLLRAACLSQHGFDLREEAEVVTGSPPLLSGLLEKGEFDAILQFWQHTPVLLATGRFRRVLDLAEVATTLWVTEPVPFGVYTFREDFVKKHPEVVRGFLAAAWEAKDHLARHAEMWPALGEQIGIADAEVLALLQQLYIQGIPRRWDRKMLADIRTLFNTLLDRAGPEVLGMASLPPATFSLEYFDAAIGGGRDEEP